METQTWIIVKNYYSSEELPWSLGDSCFNTIVGNRVGLPETINTFEEGQFFLKKMIDLNPKVDYKLVKLNRG